MAGDWSTPDRREYVSISQLAVRCGLSYDKVLADIRKGALPGYSFNGTIRIRVQDAEAYARPVKVST